MSADRNLASHSDTIVRRATLSDVEDMHQLINHFAGLGLMLPKPRSKLYQNIRDFFVAEKDGEFAGCAALHVIWNDLGEIRSLAVVERFQKNGVGRRLAVAALQDATELKLPRVFALTYQQEFFERIGFIEVEKSTLPQKVWGECMDCPKFPNCDEIAMVLTHRSSPLTGISGHLRTATPLPARRRSQMGVVPDGGSACTRRWRYL